MLCVARAQALDVPQLIQMLNAEQFEIDTLLKQKGYLLLEKEQDTGAVLHYYTHLERSDDGPSWVRSFTLIEASSDKYAGRMIRYRTYNKDEFVKLNSYLLKNQFTTKHKVQLGSEEHVVYTNGKFDIKIKTIRNKLQDGRYIKSYEYELGK